LAAEKQAASITHLGLTSNKECFSMILGCRERQWNEAEEARIAAERTKLRQQWEAEQAERLAKVCGDGAASIPTEGKQSTSDVVVMTSQKKGQNRRQEESEPQQKRKGTTSKAAAPRTATLNGAKHGTTTKATISQHAAAGSGISPQQNPSRGSMASSTGTTSDEDPAQHSVGIVQSAPAVAAGRSAALAKQIEELELLREAAAESERRCNEMLKEVAALLKAHKDKETPAESSPAHLHQISPHVSLPPQLPIMYQPVVLAPASFPNSTTTVPPSALASHAMPQLPAAGGGNILSHPTMPLIFMTNGELNPIDSRPASRIPSSLAHMHQTNTQGGVERPHLVFSKLGTLRASGSTTQDENDEGRLQHTDASDAYGGGNGGDVRRQVVSRGVSSWQDKLRPLESKARGLSSPSRLSLWKLATKFKKLSVTTKQGPEPMWVIAEESSRSLN
jgi:hypothetical protein